MQKIIRVLRFVVVDFLVAYLTWVLFFYARKALLAESIDTFYIDPLLQGVIIALFWVMLYAISGYYVNVYQKSRVSDVLANVVVAFLGSTVIFFALLLDDQGVASYKSYYKTYFALLGIHFLGSTLGRLVLLSEAKRKIRNGIRSFNTIIIGSNLRALETYNNILKINRALGLNFIGYIHVADSTDNFLKDTLRHWGDLGRLEKVIRRCNVERLIIAIEPSEHQKIADILARVDTSKIQVSVIPDIYNILIGTVRVNHLLGVPLIDIKQQLMPTWQFFVKRLFDILFSLFAISLVAPVYLLAAIMTKLSSPGPIFYKQERIGRGDMPFFIFKFRSMYVGSEKNGPALASEHDDRITKWGRFMRKTRIDELPQFYNVLKGDMSVVGPRPERRFFIEQIEEKAPHYRKLLRVRPGITSLGQIKYGYAENVGEMVKRLEFDVLYIENMSLSMDFRIILTTILIVFQGRGK